MEMKKERGGGDLFSEQVENRAVFVNQNGCLVPNVLALEIFHRSPRLDRQSSAAQSMKKCGNNTVAPHRLRLAADLPRLILGKFLNMMFGR